MLGTKHDFLSRWIVCVFFSAPLFSPMISPSPVKLLQAPIWSPDVGTHGMFDRKRSAVRNIQRSLVLELLDEPNVALQSYQARSPEESNSSHNSVEDWCEEIEEGAVYNVSLKKIQIQQAASKGARWLGVEGDEVPPGHTINRFETCRVRTIKAGTLRKLVENVKTAFDNNDFTYISIFLSTYRAFTTIDRVVELLLDGYGNPHSPNDIADGNRTSPETIVVIRENCDSLNGEENGNRVSPGAVAVIENHETFDSPKCEEDRKSRSSETNSVKKNCDSPNGEENGNRVSPRTIAVIGKNCISPNGEENRNRVSSGAIAVVRNPENFDRPKWEEDRKSCSSETNSVENNCDSPSGDENGNRVSPGTNTVIGNAENVDSPKCEEDRKPCSSETTSVKNCENFDSPNSKEASKPCSSETKSVKKNCDSPNGEENGNHVSPGTIAVIGNTENVDSPKCEEDRKPCSSGTNSVKKNCDSPNGDENGNHLSPGTIAVIGKNCDGPNGDENGNRVSPGTIAVIGKYENIDSPNCKEDGKPSCSSETKSVKNAENVDSPKCEEDRKPCFSETNSVKKNFFSPDGEENGNRVSPENIAVVINPENFDSPKCEEDRKPCSSESNSFKKNCDSPNGEENGNHVSPGTIAVIGKMCDSPNGEENGNRVSPRPIEIIENTIVSTLRAWLDQCSEDFRQVPNYTSLRKVIAYLRQMMPGSELEQRAQNLLDQFQKEESGEQELDNRNYGNITFQLGEEGGVEIEGVDEKQDILSFPSSVVAEQLTYMDAYLFKKVVPHHCLGCIWSQRDKKENKHLAPTVRATITQFNLVTKCVISTILKDLQLKPQQRAKIIDKWIHIAQECRILKNFSSLHAIVSAMQSIQIFKLKKTWAFVSKHSTSMFHELSDIFSNENNSLTSRDLLMKEGTSKFANLDSRVKENQKWGQKRLQMQKQMGVMQGTVPYLGTFLTDLTMLDTALPDYVDNGLINFEKRRKEFEIIAQIKLLQSACNNYNIDPVQKFLKWFHSQQYLTDKESYRVSCELEAAPDVSPASPKPRKSIVKRLSLLFLGADVNANGTPTKSSDQPKSPESGSSAESIKSVNVSSDSSSSESEEPCTSYAYAQEGPQKKSSESLSSSSSVHSVDTSSSSGITFRVSPPPVSPPPPSPVSLPPVLPPLPKHSKVHNHFASVIFCNAGPMFDKQKEDSCIIRVSLENDDGNLYKSVLVTNQDRAHVIIQRAMSKHNLEPELMEDYQLVQIISEDKELVIPDNANVFYALDPSVKFRFILRNRYSYRRQVQLQSRSCLTLPRSAHRLSKVTL